MEITINNKEYPFAFTYRVFKVALQHIPTDETSVTGGLDMVEYTAAAAVNAGYKRDLKDDRLSHEQFLDLLDTDPNAITVISVAVTNGMESYQGGKGDKPKKNAKK